MVPWKLSERKDDGGQMYRSLSLTPTLELCQQLTEQEAVDNSFKPKQSTRIQKVQLYFNN
jgi:hypothetical protein